MSIVAATGHRPDKLDKDYFNVMPLTQAIRDEMIQYCNIEGVTEAVSRMALGADQLWAQVALDLKIPLTCIIPFRGQELVWSRHHQRLYHEILSKAKNIIYVHDEPAPEEKWRIYSWLEDGNEYMVDYAQKLITVYDGSEGGTQNTIKYARKTKSEMPIYLIDPNVLRLKIKQKEIDL